MEIFIGSEPYTVLEYDTEGIPSVLSRYDGASQMRIVLRMSNKYESVPDIEKTIISGLSNLYIRQILGPDP